MLVDKRPEKIAGMFDAIAPRYDLLNTVLSGGTDRYWRWRAVRTLGLTGAKPPSISAREPPISCSRWRDRAAPAA